MSIASINPANGKLLRSFDPLTPEALEAKLALAAEAAKTYPKESLDQRIFWMRRLAILLDNDVEDLAATMTAEMGKTLASARIEVAKCATACRYYLENSAEILVPVTIATEHAQSYVRWDPLGVVLAVMPWNFPLWQVFRFLAPALMAGNVGLLKHASNVPQCALAIEALVRRAGFPRGVFQTLLIEARHVETVLADDRVAAVTVTGSEAAGRAVAAQAGWLIKKTVLELGGSDPFIVLEDADLDKTVEWAVWGKMNNTGQCCVAAKRFIVVEELADRFLEQFRKALSALEPGDPMDKATTLGPLSTEAALLQLLDQVTRAVAGGAKVVMGGKRINRPGSFMQPTILTDIAPGNPAFREEFFGPVALLFRVKNEDEAVALANDSDFGLGGSVFTKNIARGKRVASRIDTGMVFINHPTWTSAELPFGGIKNSGYGRELSSLGIQEFVNKKLVRVASIDAAA